MDNGNFAKEGLLPTLVGVGLSLIVIYAVFYAASKGWKKGEA